MSLSRHTFRFRADFQAFLTPDALDLFTANRPALLNQQGTDAPIAIARMLPGQNDNTPVQLDLLGQRLLDGISIGGTMQSQIATGPPLRAQPLVNNMCYGSFLLHWAYHFFELTSPNTRFFSIASASIFFFQFLEPFGIGYIHVAVFAFRDDSDISMRYFRISVLNYNFVQEYCG
jgi:hypothetical protein